MKLDKNGKLPWQTHPPSILVHQRHHAWSTFKSVKHRLGNRSAEASMAYKASVTRNNKYRNSAVQRKNPLHYATKNQKFSVLGKWPNFSGSLGPIITEMGVGFDLKTLFRFSGTIFDFWPQNSFFAHHVQCSWEIDLWQLSSHFLCHLPLNDTWFCIFTPKNDVITLC